MRTGSKHRPDVFQFEGGSSGNQDDMGVSFTDNNTSMNSDNPQADSRMTGGAPPPSSQSTVTSDSKSIISQRSDMSNPKGRKKKKRKRPTAHFKKRGHPCWKVCFIVSLILAIFFFISIVTLGVLIAMHTSGSVKLP